MTSVIQRSAQPWSTMPGWGIFADLMPPELQAARKLKGLRRALLAGLVILVLACVGGYVYAMNKHSSAQSALDQAQANTATVRAEQNKYADVTQLRTAATGIQSQVAAAMADDVDFGAFIAQVRAALPGSLAITSLTITIAPNSGSTAPSLSSSAAPQIGTVTLGGTGKSLADLSGYVVKLAALPAVIDVIPTTNSASGAKTAFNVSFGITSALYSHLFTVKAGGN
jgi:hypothetical protein